VLLAVPRVVALTLSEPTLGTLAAIVPLGALSTGAGYLTFATLVRRAGATRGAVAIYLVPVVAIALGAVFRGEHPGDRTASASHRFQVSSCLLLLTRAEI
jgi:drug/metabolite transporter (DMT)-like permease